MRLRDSSGDWTTGVVLVVFYVLSFWPLLVNNGIFWDDWVLYGQTSADAWRASSASSARRSAGYLVRRVASPRRPCSAKWFVFAIYLAAMLVVYQVLSGHRLFGEERGAVLLTLFATLIPYNFARITTMCALVRRVLPAVPSGPSWRS